MSYVDLMSDVRWSEADHVARVEAFVRSTVTETREHVLTRRAIAFTFYVLAQGMPDGPSKTLLAQFGRPLTSAALNELAAAAQVFDAADTLALQARADSARLDAALDYEAAEAELEQLPPVPEDGSADPDAERRAQLQAIVADASADTLDLVALRAANRAILTAAETP